MPQNFISIKSPKFLRIVTFLIFLLLIAWSGWQMLRLPLWGWWPLVFLLSIWLAGVTLFFPKDPEKRKWLGAATIAGVLLGIGFPPSPFTWVIFFAWIPLLAVENGIYHRQEKVKPGQVFLFSLHAFVLWNVIATFWVTNTAFIAGIFANFVNAALMATVMMLVHIVARKLRPKLFPVVLISFWIAFEFLHHHWDTSWPWLTLGNSLAEYPWMAQWYEYTGIFGGSLWILIINILGYVIITRWLRAVKLPVVQYIVVLMIPIVVSLFLWVTTKPSNADPVPIIVVQPNFEPHYQKFDISQREQALRFLHLSEQQLDSTVRYLVFPETSFEGIQLNTFRDNDIIAGFQNLINRYSDLHLVTGLSSYRVLTPEESNSPNTRTHINRQGDTTLWDVQNSAVQISSGRQSFQLYFKSKFVPGPEIFPYKEYLFFLRPIIDKLGGSYEGHTSQETREVFEGPLNVAPIICYESVYGDYTGGYVRNGANAFFIVTNDGWWDNTPGHLQHLKIGALRAIEHRRPIARSANTGISCFIDIKGRVLQPTKYDEPTSIKGNLTPETRITFYTKFGDLIAIAMVILTCMFLLNHFVNVIRGKLTTPLKSGKDRVAMN